MTREELIAQLQREEQLLRSEPVQEFIRGQDLSTREAFVSLRGHLTGLIDELRIAQLKDIAADLERLSPDIQRGIDELQGTINRMNDAIAIVNTLSRVIGLVTRVVGFAATV
jgi:hypothetical protein